MSFARKKCLRRVESYQVFKMATLQAIFCVVLMLAIPGIRALQTCGYLSCEDKCCDYDMDSCCPYDIDEQEAIRLSTIAIVFIVLACVTFFSLTVCCIYVLLRRRGRSPVVITGTAPVTNPYHAGYNQPRAVTVTATQRPEIPVATPYTPPPAYQPSNTTNIVV